MAAHSIPDYLVDDDEAPVEPVVLMRKDLRAAAATLGLREVRFLVNTYYQIQEYRKAAAAQVRGLTVAGDPNQAILWTEHTMRQMESDIKIMLDRYTATEPTGMGAWARSICGIGPVIAAGLLAHIDITKAQTAGAIWRYAGLEPSIVWEKGQKRPYNADLKVLCYKIGESFVKVQNRPQDYYGKLYAQRKALEQTRNEQGLFADQAREKLAKFKIGRDTDAYIWYSQGKLPPARIHARARRWAVKLFLAHYFEESYRRHYGTEPPVPYPIAHLGHVHRIEPPAAQPQEE